jgi:endonuclease/exonuclease/phosphatase family metal-dependent hydrolase
VEAVQGADVIALQEVDRFWARSGTNDQIALLVESFPGYDYAFGPGVDQASSRAGLDGRPIRRQFG